MTRARYFLLVLATAISPALASCGALSIPPAAQFAPTSQTVSVFQGAQETPLKKYTLTGAWSGKWSGDGSSGGFSMHVRQKGKTFSGPVAITIKKVTVKATIKGTIRKGKISLTVSQTQLGTGKGTATTNKTRTTMKGSITFSKTGTISFNANKS